MRIKLVPVVVLLCLSAVGQQYNYFINGFLQMPNAPAARTYLGVTSGSSGSVTNFSIGNLPPLFTSSVANPTFWPSVTFSITSQSANTVLAGPASGGAAAPTFRALQPTDISGVVTQVNNGATSGTSLLTSSNPPVPLVKTISAGPNVTVSDNGGTNITISASSGAGGGASGADLIMTNLTAYANGTNFYVDFSFPSAYLQSTGDIAFNYSTNWGLSQTSRVCNVYIPATNIFRHVLFLNAATNWHNNLNPMVAVPTGYGAKIQMQEFGVGETNVAYTPQIDLYPVTTNWIAAGFNPTNSQGGCVLWWEASQKTFQDEQGTTPVVDGSNVRHMLDLSNTYGKATNGSVSAFCFYRGPNSAPGNIPCLNFVPVGVGYLVTTNFSSLSQPNWAFIMYYGRGSSLILLDGLSEGNRFACQVSETPAISTAVYSGTSLTFTPGTGIGWRLFAFKQNSTTSIIRTNGVQAASGNSGTQTPQRWTLGSDYNLGNVVGNNYVAEILVYHTNLSDLQLTNVENYFRTKYGAW